MDAEERARRREERRRKREEESAAAETNGPTEETEEDHERRERRSRERAALSNETEEDDSERLRQEEEEQRQREEEEEAARRKQEEAARKAEERKRQAEAEQEERRKQDAAKEKERKRNAELERQRQEDLQREEDAKEQPGEAAPAKKKGKMGGLLGRVSKGRKKEILAMLLKKARGDLQLEEQEAALEKSKFIEEKVKETNVDSLNKTQLIKLCEELHEQLQAAEGDKFDLEIKVKRRDLQISTLKVKANETRGRFALPTLKSTKITASAKPKETSRKDFRSDLKKAEQTDEN
ncbi:uncharacterized protein [Apostichopus japonicus]|uniref:uncharacterized protein isoform X4 n=1 Tax=Stichopus japonicus TaxID=307972 RepID=UPI003AB816AF